MILLLGFNLKYQKYYFKQNDECFVNFHIKIAQNLLLQTWIVLNRKGKSTVVQLQPDYLQKVRNYGVFAQKCGEIRSKSEIIVLEGCRENKRSTEISVRPKTIFNCCNSLKNTRKIYIIKYKSDDMNFN